MSDMSGATSNVINAFQMQAAAKNQKAAQKDSRMQGLSRGVTGLFGALQKQDEDEKAKNQLRAMGAQFGIPENSPIYDGDPATAVKAIGDAMEMKKQAAGMSHDRTMQADRYAREDAQTTLGNSAMAEALAPGMLPDTQRNSVQQFGTAANKSFQTMRSPTQQEALGRIPSIAGRFPTADLTGAMSAASKIPAPPKPVDPLATQETQAEIDLKKAQAERARRGEAPPDPLDSEKKKAEIERLKAQTAGTGGYARSEPKAPDPQDAELKRLRIENAKSLIAQRNAPKAARPDNRDSLEKLASRISNPADGLRLKQAISLATDATLGDPEQAQAIIAELLGKYPETGGSAAPAEGQAPAASKVDPTFKAKFDAIEKNDPQRAKNILEKMTPDERARIGR